MQAERPETSPPTRGRTVIAVGPIPPPHDGTSIPFEDACNELVRRGADLLVVDMSPRRVRPRGWRRNMQRTGDWVRVLRQLHGSLSGAHDPVVYLTLGQSPIAFARDVASVLVARAHGAQLVGHVHGGSYHLLYEEGGRLRRALVRWLVRRLDRVVVEGERLRDMFAFAPEVRNRLLVVHNGLPADSFMAEAPRVLPEGEPLRVLYLSNLIRSKGYLELLEAAALARAAGRDVRVDLAGEFHPGRGQSVTQLHSELIDRIRALGLESAVEYHGVVLGQTKRDLLRQAHLFALPTRYRFEGQPVSIIEALAAGLPVVATRYRAIPDMVDDGHSGILVDEPEPRLLADAILRLGDPETYHAASEAALRAVRERFTAERYRARVAAVLGV